MNPGKASLILILLCCFLTIGLKAQSVGINTTSPAPSAVLDITSTDKGVLIPRMNSGQRTGIMSPAIGLLVFDTDTESFWYHQSSGWFELVRGAFANDGGIVRSTGNYGVDDFVFGADALPPTTSTSDTLFLFDKSKGAFRAGRVFNTKDWAPDSLGFCSFAAGSNVLAKGIYSFAGGRDSDASGDYAVGLGYNVKARGVASTAFGFGTEASGPYSMASGASTNASGYYSSAFGQGTIASGSAGSFAAGSGTTASGVSSFAIGNGTTASGSRSLATGYQTSALGSYATALGYTTVAESYGSVALGRYNVAGGNKTSWQSTDPLFEIGIGTSVSDKSNALTVLKNGTISFKAYTFPLNDGSANQHLSTDGSGQLEWQNDIGAFVRNGELVKTNGNYDTDDFLFGSENLPNTGVPSDTLMMFDKSKGAFRAGGYNGNHWVPDSIGRFSMAVGFKTKASGEYSVAIGNNSRATKYEAIAIGGYSSATAPSATAIGGTANALGLSSTALSGGDATAPYTISIGRGTEATASGSVCIGEYSTASGQNSIALGYFTFAEASNAVAIGHYNIGGGNPSVWIPTDPLFEVGNGDPPNASNAFTILKNGDTRIQHSDNAGAGGLKLENSNSEDFIRLYVSSSSADLRLYSKSQGANIIGFFDDVSGAYTALSDARVKKNAEDLHFIWEDFMRLKPLSYQFKAEKSGKRSIGMFAQEVQSIYPEMVTYHEEEDLYHLDYSGFGVIAIKAVQELKQELKQKDELLEVMVQKNMELESRLERLEALINK